MADTRITEDPRIDPRIRALFGLIDMEMPPMADAQSREQLLAEANTDEAVAQRADDRRVLGLCDTEEVAPSKGLDRHRAHVVVSAPDGNTINVRSSGPTATTSLPCVYYIHGGGMANMSCYDGNYRAWGRIIAAQGVAVAMVDFRNAARRPRPSKRSPPIPPG